MPDNGPWITKTIIDLEEQVAELECMVRAFRACVDIQMVPSWGSHCHDQIYALVGKNTEEGT
jgi:tetrahydromethanopterin S-methyltransferase subunit B